MDRVFVVSFLVFIILNLIENIIHYSIGRMKDRASYAIYVQKPSVHDFVKIVVIMLVFAFLQGFFTWLFET